MLTRAKKLALGFFGIAAIVMIVMTVQGVSFF
jgi:hypothetical protein